MGLIEIRMERNFDEFDDDSKKRFFESLSSITGASMDDLQKGKFIKGCVIYRVQLPVEPAVKLMSLAQKKGANILKIEFPEDAPEEVIVYYQFLKENDVVEIRDLDLDKAIITSRTKSKGPKVVFVHGWKSDPKKAFGKLPTEIENLTGFSTYCYKYPTGKIGSFPSLISIVQHMDNEVAKETQHNEIIAFIGHSMGGLIARRLLVGQHDGTALRNKRVRQLTLIASPSVGSSLATVANIATLFTNNQLEDLRKDSRFMQDFIPRWTSWERMYVPKETVVRAIFGEKDNIVPRSEAMLFDPRPVPISDADHSSVVNPSSEEMRLELTMTLKYFLEEAL